MWDLVRYLGTVLSRDLDNSENTVSRHYETSVYRSIVTMESACMSRRRGKVRMTLFILIRSLGTVDWVRRRSRVGSILPDITMHHSKRLESRQQIVIDNQLPVYVSKTKPIHCISL